MLSYLGSCTCVAIKVRKTKLRKEESQDKVDGGSRIGPQRCKRLVCTRLREIAPWYMKQMEIGKVAAMATVMANISP